MNTEFQDLPNVVSPKEVQTYFGISRSTTYRISHAQPPTAYSMMQLFLRFISATGCWCGGMNCWAGWNGKRSIKAQNENPKIVGSDE